MAGMGNYRHLQSGSLKPPKPGKDVVRVYGMKFCPYAQRLQLVLAAKGIKHETVNINLYKKPKWYFEKNPRGLVPTLEINDDIIYESDVTSEYIDSVYPGRKLMTQDPLKLAKEKMFLGDHANTISGFYKFVFAKENDDEQRKLGKETATKGLGLLKKFLDNAGTPFVCGDQPGFTDYMIWTHIERIGAFIPDLITIFDTVQGYFNRMGEDEAVKACRFSNELHREFYNLPAGGEGRQYDCGEVLEYDFPTQ